LIADRLLDSIGLLTQACFVLRRHCVEGIEADEARCRRQVESSTAVATALVGALGYETVSDVAKRAAETGLSIRDVVLDEGLLSETAFEDLLSPEAVMRLGTPDAPGHGTSGHYTPYQRTPHHNGGRA
jgi:aspartate ammonia-lyase